MSHAELSPRPVVPGMEALAPRVLATVRSVADELRPQARLADSLGLDHSLERDYGLDSLARVELITRIDHDLGVSLGEAALTEAETPRDLLRFITRTGDRGVAPAASVGQPPIDHCATTDGRHELLPRHPDRRESRRYPAFNEELGRLTLLSYSMIALPSLLIMMATLYYLARTIRELAGLMLAHALEH